METIKHNEKGTLEEFESIQQIIDLMKSSESKEQNAIAAVIEKQEDQVSPVMIRMAMQSLGYEVPKMHEVEVFLNELRADKKTA